MGITWDMCSIHLCDNAINLLKLHICLVNGSLNQMFGFSFCKKHSDQGQVHHLLLWGHILTVSFVSIYISSVLKKKKGAWIALFFFKCLCFNLRNAFVSVKNILYVYLVLLNDEINLHCLRLLVHPYIYAISRKLHQSKFLSKPCTNLRLNKAIFFKGIQLIPGSCFALLMKVIDS